MSKPGDLLEIVKLVDPSYGGIAEQSILDAAGEIVGWHSTVKRNNGDAVGGGTAADRQVARRIAIAEFLERGLFENLMKDRARISSFGLDKIPTTSGFAAGFDLKSTRTRSICEGVERWAWSKWIDSHHLVLKLDVAPAVSELAVTLQAPFSQVLYFQRKMKLDILQVQLELNFNVFVGLTAQGAFAGSRVTGAEDDQWTHGTIEAWRNWNNFEIARKAGMLDQAKGWLAQRVHYFGEHRKAALSQIESAKNPFWPNPKLGLCVGDQPYPGVHIWRTLLEDFVPWHQGPRERFVY